MTAAPKAAAAAWIIAAALTGAGVWAARPAPVVPVSHPGPTDPPLTRLECDRCHDATSRWQVTSRDRSCVDCHEAIRAGELDAHGLRAWLPTAWTGQYPTEITSLWKANLHSLLDVPSLEGVETRLRRSWVEAWLAAPHAVRPGLGATMPRFPLRLVPAAKIVDALYAGGAGPSDAPIPPGDAPTGRDLLRAKGCLDCHAFSCLDDAVAERRDAPDLRWTRDRSPPGVILAWLADPTSIAPATTMPRPDLTEQERLDLVAAIVETDCAPLPTAAPPPAAPPPAAPPPAVAAPPPAVAAPPSAAPPPDPASTAPPSPIRYVPPGAPRGGSASAAAPTSPSSAAPPITRPVTWDEVNERVFSRTCRHCHSSSATDPGPGAGGGFGWAGVNLDLSSRDGVLAGSTCGSVTQPQQGQAASLVAAMRARHDELRGVYTETLGMPMSLPPVPWEDIALVEAWLAQGAPP